MGWLPGNERGMSWLGVAGFLVACLSQVRVRQKS